MDCTQALPLCLTVRQTCDLYKTAERIEMDSFGMEATYGILYTALVFSKI